MHIGGLRVGFDARKVFLWSPKSIRREVCRSVSIKLDVLHYTGAYSQDWQEAPILF